jgi:hypothetical protein
MAQHGDNDRIAWHPASFSAIKLELEAWEDALEFTEEYQLNREPLKIDILVIKKRPDAVIEKNFARIFRAHNLVEYKSPTDYLSIHDFRKVYAYTLLYIIDQNITDRDVTITFIESRHPKDLLRYFAEERGWPVTEPFPGIYHISGDIIPIQVIETKKLSEADNFWLKNLRNDLEARAALAVLDRVTLRTREDVIKSYLYPILEANAHIITEVEGMTEKMRKTLEATGWTKEWEAWGRAAAERDWQAERSRMQAEYSQVQAERSQLLAENQALKAQLEKWNSSASRQGA